MSAGDEAPDPRIRAVEEALPGGFRVVAGAAVPAPDPGGPRVRRRQRHRGPDRRTSASPRIQVEEVLSYYTQLRRSPIGRWHVQACRNVTCSMRGAERVVDHLSRRLGIAPGETTADGRFTLTTVECLGSCGTAPVVMLNDAYHENMSHRAARRADRRAGLTCQAPAHHELPGDGHVAPAGRLPRARRLRGAPEGAVVDDADRGDQGGDRVGASRPRRRRVPGRPQVGGGQARRRPAALPLRQRRRGRAGHVQGSLGARARAPPADRVDADRVVRAAGPQRLRLHPRRVRPAVPAAARRRSRKRTPRACSASASWAPTSAATSSSTAARGLTSAARRRA